MIANYWAAAGHYSIAWEHGIGRLADPVWWLMHAVSSLVYRLFRHLPWWLLVMLAVGLGAVVLLRWSRRPARRPARARHRP